MKIPLLTYLAAILLVGCGPWGEGGLQKAEVTCKTRCGAELYWSEDCDGFQHAEDKLLEAAVANMDSAMGWTPNKLCRKLQDVEVWVRQPGVKGAGTWLSDTTGGLTGGETYCNKGSVIGTDDWYLNSYAHEMLHIFDGCKSREHEFWNERGYYATVQAARWDKDLEDKTYCEAWERRWEGK